MIACPNATHFSPKVARSCFPTTFCNHPSCLGNDFSSAIINLPDSLAASIAELLILLPETLLENFTIASPNATHLSPNSAKSDVPTISANPPDFGSAFCSSAIALPAVAAAVTAPSSIFPDTASENLTIALPKDSSCVPRDEKSVVPNPKKDDIPDIKSAAVKATTVSAKIFADLTLPASIEVIPLKKPEALSIKSDKSVPRSANDDPYCMNEDIPAIKSAAVRSTIAPDKYPIPVSTSFPILLDPLIKPSAFFMKSDKDVPNFGNISRTPSINPETIEPINSPIPVPIALSNGIPLFKKVSTCGNCSLMYPSIPMKVPITVTTPIRPIAPATAILVAGPIAERIAVTPAIATNNIESAVAVSILGFILKCSIIPNITASPATTRVITAIPASAVVLISLTTLNTASEADILTKSILNPSAF